MLGFAETFYQIDIISHHIFNRVDSSVRLYNHHFNFKLQQFLVNMVIILCQK